MAAFTWTTGSSGDWSLAGNWTPTGGPPDADTDTALINAAGSYTVTIASSESYTANTVTLDDADAVLSVSGTLTLAGTAPALTVTAGEFDLYGILDGGTVEAPGGTLVIENGAELDGVTWQAPLTFAANVSLNVIGGLTVETASGGTPGVIDMTAGNDALYVLDSETLNNATLNFGSGSILDNDDNAGGTLTLGSGFTINASGGEGGDLQNEYGGTIANAGQIDVTDGSLLDVVGGGFTNSGSFTISGGGFVYIDTTTFTSSDAISIGSGGTLEIVPATSADVTYDDAATLILDNPTTYTGTLSGFTAGDMLQLDGEDISSASIVGTTLTVNLSGGGTLTYNTGPGLNGLTFTPSEGSDGYQDLLTALCFAAGTHILTA